MPPSLVTFFKYTYNSRENLRECLEENLFYEYSYHRSCMHVTLWLWRVDASGQKY